MTDPKPCPECGGENTLSPQVDGGVGERLTGWTKGPIILSHADSLRILEVYHRWSVMVNPDTLETPKITDDELAAFSRLECELRARGIECGHEEKVT